MKAIDHRVKVTKILIEKALIKILMEKPLSNITVKELCIEAGINRGTFYNNYNDIQDLLNQIEAGMLEELSKRLEPVLTDDITPFTVSNEVFKLVKENSELFCVTLGPNGDKNFLKTIFNLGREHCLRNYSNYYDHISPEKLEIHYTFVSAGCGALLEKWLLGDIDMTVEEIGRTVEEIIYKGVRYLIEDETRIRLPQMN